MKRCKRNILLFICVFAAKVLYAQQVGDTVYHSGFSQKDTMWQNAGGCRYRYVSKDGGGAVMIKKGMLKIPFAAAPYAGTKIAVNVRLKSNGVSEKPRPWNGVKVMVHIPVPWDDLYPQTDFTTDAFDWKQAGFNAFVPAGADTFWLYLGLEKVTGKIWIDEVTLTVSEAAPKLPETINTDAVYKGHSEKRLRGMMVPTNIADTDINTLAQWGANHIRWQLTWDGFPRSKADMASEFAYRQWINSCLQHIDKLLPQCRKVGIRLVIDLHSLPGGRFPNEVTHRLFHDTAWQRVFRDTWKQIALRYKNEPAVWGYDLANEPEEGIVPAGLMNWQQLATAAAQDIRTVDTTHAIIVEGAPRGGPEALARMEPIPVKGVVYSFHMYVPALFTHQGVDFDDSSRYPGVIQGREWNITTMRKTFEQVRRWQQTYNTHIYVGEFSAIRWATAQSAYYYLRDCIDLFEEYEWDWAYHAFREWHGWSIEHTELKNNELPAAIPTERQMLLMKWFGKNKD